MKVKSCSKKSFLTKISIILADLMILLIVLYIDNVISVMKIVAPFCLLNIFGLKCGICGGTHSLYYLVNGDFIKAIQSNFLVPFAVLFFIIAYFICHLAYLFDIGWAKSIMKKYIFTLPCFLSITVPFIIYGLIRSILAMLN